MAHSVQFPARSTAHLQYKEQQRQWTLVRTEITKIEMLTVADKKKVNINTGLLDCMIIYWRRQWFSRLFSSHWLLLPSGEWKKNITTTQCTPRRSETRPHRTINDLRLIVLTETLRLRNFFHDSKTSCIIWAQPQAACSAPVWHSTIIDSSIHAVYALHTSKFLVSSTFQDYFLTDKPASLMHCMDVHKT